MGLNTPEKPNNSGSKSSTTVKVSPRILSTNKKVPSNKSDNSLSYFDSADKTNKLMDNQTQPQPHQSPPQNTMVPVTQEYLQNMLRNVVGEIRSECKYLYK